VGLEKVLNDRLLAPDAMRKEVREIVKQAKENDTWKHKRQPEDAFLYHFAFPIIFEHMQTVDGIDQQCAKQTLLSEYYRNMKEWCSGTPARKQRHPFNKVIGARPAEIMAQWKGEFPGASLKQSCPDFAFREPFSFKTVFEGKYFEKGGHSKAETELVNSIYQAFFYRALPFIPGTAKMPAWDYEFSCLFVYDASPDGTLQAAWKNLRKEVRSGFWEGANVYVMILRGKHA
jgi:hypothetical protein